MTRKNREPKRPRHESRSERKEREGSRPSPKSLYRVKLPRVHLLTHLPLLSPKQSRLPLSPLVPLQEREGSRPSPKSLYRPLHLFTHLPLLSPKQSPLLSLLALSFPNYLALPLFLLPLPPSFTLLLLPPYPRLIPFRLLHTHLLSRH